MSRYAFESHPNTKIRTIHLERRIPTISWYSSGKLTHEAQKMKEALLKIDGVTEVQSRDYSLTVTRSGVFTWSEILPKCIEVLKSMMAVDAMEEVTAFAE